VLVSVLLSDWHTINLDEIVCGKRRGQKVNCIMSRLIRLFALCWSLSVNVIGDSSEYNIESDFKRALMIQWIQDLVGLMTSQNDRTLIQLLDRF
jgi:hypothetical protein